MQATPSRRIPAPRPGLTETLRRFTAGPGRRCKPSFILKVALLLQLKNYWGSLSPRGEGEYTPLYLRCRNKQIPQLMQLIADLRGLFELQILRMLHHLPFQLVDLLLQRFRRQRDGILFHH